MWHSQKLFFFATCLGGCAVLFLAALALSVAFYYIPVDANIVQHSCIVQNVDIDARTCCHQQCSGTDTRHCNSICNTCYDVIVDYRFVLNEQPSAHRETAISGTSLGRANSYRDGHPPESPIRCYHINYTSKEAKRAFKKRECYERAAELEKQIGQVGERMPDYEHHQLVLSDAWFACERYDLARSNYAKRSKLGGDRQEVYYSLVRISECYRLEKNTQAALEASLDAHAQFPRRAEPLYQAGLFYMELEQHDKAFTLLKKALQLPYPVGQQFVAEDVYRYALAQVFAMCSYTVGEHQQCFDVACDLLNENRLPEVEREAMQKLRLMCVKHIKDSLLNYDAARVSRICNRSKRKRKLPILFSITTCRRLDLFVRTMNSFLNCCGDLDMIEEWLCVDDNSSEEDIAEMKRLFPFMTFVCKSEEDKGHARSLNLIRKYAIAGKYEYLLHLEDDWQFFEQRSYIEPAVHIFDSTRKKNGLSVYGQVLFNRNYAEVEKCIEIVGGQVRYSPERGLRFLEHEHLSPEEFKERFSEPCLHNAHWPHYSLRPSLIDCKALFLIGEYNEQAVHFEMEYAERYERLFKSCFFDSIVCLHTGKLTNEEGENTSSLNGQQQFAQ